MESTIALCVERTGDGRDGINATRTIGENWLPKLAGRAFLLLREGFFRINPVTGNIGDLLYGVSTILGSISGMNHRLLIDGFVVHGF